MTLQDVNRIDYLQDSNSTSKVPQNTIKKTIDNKTKEKKFCFILGGLMILGIIVIFVSNSYKLAYFKSLYPENLLELDQSEDQSFIQDHELKQKKKRNLSVWTKNCCPTTQTCGIFSEDCCTVDERGCNWYFFCYEISDDKDCKRVKSIMKKMDGYWAI